MKKFIITALALSVSAGLYAQNLNPVVEVTNTYAREASGIDKPAQLLSVPDSVYSFNLDMDYSVRNTPYQGSYEFKPYRVQLRPQPRQSEEGRLFVRLGAGYGLHPEATVIWTPVRKGHFRLNLFADHASYVGSYRNITLQDKLFLADGTCRFGKNLQSALGADALYTWTGGSFAADIKYRNITGRDLAGMDASNNQWQLKARVKSAPGNAFAYNAGTRVTYVGVQNFHELHTQTDGAFGTHWDNHHVLMGLFAETVSQPQAYVGSVGLVPHYLLSTGRFNMKLGVKLSFLFRSAKDFCPHGGWVFPDVHITFKLAPEAAALYFQATGGDHLISYDKLLGLNPFVYSADWRTDNMITRVNAAVGGRGNIASRFHYDVRVGYKWDENAWTWGVADGVKPTVGYASPLHTFYVLADLGWKDEKLDIGAQVYYGYTPMPDLQGQTLFAPAPFKASGHAFYNWGGRVQAGIVAEGRSALPGPLKVPGYVDLGVQANFQMTRSLGFWLKGGNLLNQTIQRVPLYAEQGIYFTVGATFSI